MNYKERYEQALERAKECLKDDSIIAKAYVESIFPELTMSEDEKMKDYIKDVIQAAIIPKKENKQKMIAWLEKQGEQKPILDFKASDWYVSKVDGKIHNMYHSDDKVEPKFNVDDWVILNGIVAKILDKQKYGFVGLDIDGKDFFCNYGHTDSMRLWSINDANDGDVLMTTKTRNCPFIYRKTDYNNNLAYYYAGVDGNGDFCEGCLKRTLYHFGSIATITPATKEQRELLFQKMKEAGYVWDAEKKELKKIKPKTLDANKVIEWLKNTIKVTVENYGVYNETRLTLPYNSIEELINDFKKDFRL